MAGRRVLAYSVVCWQHRPSQHLAQNFVPLLRIRLQHLKLRKVSVEVFMNSKLTLMARLGHSILVFLILMTYFASGTWEFAFASLVDNKMFFKNNFDKIVLFWQLAIDPDTPSVVVLNRLDLVNVQKYFSLVFVGAVWCACWPCAWSATS